VPLCLYDFEMDPSVLKVSFTDTHSLFANTLPSN
jgi:hypothetical protein